jgi:acyl carrier protein
MKAQPHAVGATAVTVVTASRGGASEASARDARQRIRDFIVESFFVDDFDDDASFLRTGIVDSMGMGHLVAFLEDTFGIALADAELVPENLDSLSRVTAFVERKLREPP